MQPAVPDAEGVVFSAAKNLEVRVAPNFLDRKNLITLIIASRSRIRAT